jgi:hypothetical protein
MPAGAQRIAFLVVGIVIGSGIVVATLRFATPAEKIVYREAPAQSAPKSTDSITPPKPVGPATDKASPKSDVKPADKQTHAESGPPDPNLKPYSPFKGEIPAMPPVEITGQVPSGPNPAKEGPKIVPHEEPAVPRGLLVTVRMDVADGSAAVKALQSLAAKFGGSAVRFDELAKKEDPEGAILVVPAAKADEAERELTAVGSVVASDRWSGSSGDRVDRIEQVAESRLSDLHVQRQELVVRYFEDAPQVKHVDEDSARITKCLVSFRSLKSGPTTAVFKVRFLG